MAPYCEVKNPLGLAAFLTTVRAFAEQSAPRMTIWESLEYHGQAYVKITAEAVHGGEAPEMEQGGRRQEA